jgi:P27 family predicted phage terminase small subunit
VITAIQQNRALYHSEYRDALQLIFDNGFTYTTITQAGDKMVRPYPQVAIAQNAWRRVSDMLKQLGLTPSARTGVEAIKPEEEDPFELFLKQGVKPYPVK